MTGITKQKHSNDTTLYWNRGKGLGAFMLLSTFSWYQGGSSALNFYSRSKPPAADIDAIEKLGNPGWNFKEYLKYSLMSETYVPLLWSKGKKRGWNLYALQFSSCHEGPTCQFSSHVHPWVPAEPPGLFILPFKFPYPISMPYVHAIAMQTLRWWCSTSNSYETQMSNHGTQTSEEKFTPVRRSRPTRTSEAYWSFEK